MTTKVGTFQVPFHPDGEMYERDMSGLRYPPIIWENNYAFEDTMEIGPTTRDIPKRCPRSTACNLVSMTDGKHYVMYMSDLVFMIQNTEIDHGHVHGRWTFVRHGTSYGIALLA